MAQMAANFVLAMLVALYAQDGGVSRLEWRRPGGAPPVALQVAAAPGGYAILQKSSDGPLQVAFVARDAKDAAVFRLGEPGHDLQSPPIDLATVVADFAKLDLRHSTRAAVHATLAGESVTFDLSRDGGALVLDQAATGDRFTFR